jgi:lipopolysaccharide assembly outer membrane protein LptD (OstA)
MSPLTRLVPLALLVAFFPQLSASQETEQEPWHITGDRLEGIFGGRSRLDKVIIRHGSLRASALEGIWDPATEILTLSGTVEISDTARVMNSDFALYDRRTRVLTMEGDVLGRGPEGLMGGDHLIYRRAEGSARLLGDPWLQDEEYRVEADTLDYDDVKETAEARGHVDILTLTDSSRVSGDFGLLDRQRDFMMVVARPPQRPRLTRPAAEGEPPLVIVADTLRMERGGDHAEALGDVIIQQGEMGASGEHARFFVDGDRMELLESPRAWERDGVISGDTLRLFLEEGEPQRLLVLGNARAEYLPKDRPGEETFSVGDTMVAHFRDQVLRALDVRGRAQSLYVPAIQDRRADVGKNWSRARSLTVGFRDGQAHRVDLMGDAEGIYSFPRKISPDTLVLSLPDSVSPPDSVAQATEAPRPGQGRRSSSLHPFLQARRDLLEKGDLMEPDSLTSLGPFDPAENVVYRGKQIAFLIPEDRVAMKEAGEVEYQGMSLSAESIQFNSVREAVVATGEPVLKDKGSEIFGERMTYRLDTRKGVVFRGKTDFENGYYRGREIKKLSGHILYARDAEYTTCDLDTAHFHFWSSAVKIKVKDKAVARPVVLKLGRIPLMAIPYWIFPLRSGRRSGILFPEVEFGFDRTRGRFVRNTGYYFALSDYMDLLTWGDYYERGPRFIANARYRYKIRYLLSGQAFGSYSTEKLADGSRSVSWDVKADHEQTLAENLTLKFRADFVSDATYRGDRDFGAGTDERLNRTLKSNIDLRKRWTWGSLSATVNRTENLDDSFSNVKIQLLAPSLDFSPTSFTLGRAAGDDGTGGRLPFLSSTYFRTGFSLRNIRTDFFDGTEETNTAMRETFSLTDNRRLFGVLNFAPSFSATVAAFAEDNLGERNEVGGVWSTGASASTTIYGTFFPNIGPLSGIRHILEPAASYRYQPEFTSLQYADTNGVMRNRFPTVAGIGLGGSKVSSVGLRLTQKVNLKLRSGDEEKKIDNLILWTTSTGFNFLTDTWSSLQNTIRLSPARFLESRLNVTYDIERAKRTQLGLQTYLRFSGQGLGSQLPEYGEFGEPGIQGNSNPGDGPAPGTTGGPWNLSITHTFNQGESSSSRRSDVNVTASLSVTANWRLSYSVYYDLIDKEIKTQGFTLYRDLHCWEARLERRSSGRSSQFYFRINVKQLQDVKYERNS